MSLYYTLRADDLFTSEVHSNRESGIQKEEEGEADSMAEVPVDYKSDMSLIWAYIRRATADYQGRGKSTG